MKSEQQTVQFTIVKNPKILTNCTNECFED